MSDSRVKSIGRDNAIKLAESGWWKDKSAKEICDIQLFTKELCMNFADFHLALESCLGRGVYTHELGLDYSGIVDEYLGERTAPSLNEILALIPSDKAVILV